MYKMAVLDGCCAAQSGLQVGDEINGWNGAETTSGNELESAIRGTLLVM